MAAKDMNASSQGVKWNQGFTGCGDHGCIVKKPIGQGTNGGCRCPAQVLKVIIRRLQATLDGDPHFTATPELRKAWRASAVRYSLKLEKEIEALKEKLDTSDFIDVVFDGPPSHESGRFVEVENPEGKSISIGEWIEREDGCWALRIARDDPGMDEDQEKRLEALEKEVGRIEHDIEHGPSETPPKH